MIGAHAFKFADAATALASLATLPGFIADEHQLRVAEKHGAYTVVDWGTQYRETGNTVTVDGIDVPETEAIPGHWVYLLTPDALPPEGWEPFSAVDRADAPLVEIGGHYALQQDSQDLAEITDDTVPTGTPPKLTDKQKEALQDIRSQRLAIIEPWLTSIQALNDKRRELESLPKSIAAAITARDKAVNQINTLATARDQVIADKDVQVAIAADAGRPSQNRQAASEERDRLNDEIDRVRDEITSLDDLRDSLNTTISTLQSLAKPLRDERQNMYDEVQKDRPGVLESLASLRKQRDKILGI